MRRGGGRPRSITSTGSGRRSRRSARTRDVAPPRKSTARPCAGGAGPGRLGRAGRMLNEDVLPEDGGVTVPGLGRHTGRRPAARGGQAGGCAGPTPARPGSSSWGGRPVGPGRGLGPAGWAHYNRPGPARPVPSRLVPPLLTPPGPGPAAAASLPPRAGSLGPRDSARASCPPGGPPSGARLGTTLNPQAS